MMARTIGLETLKRIATLKTHKIHSLPIVILMPHSNCNCRCVMCDIWRGKGTAQLTEADVRGLLGALEKLGTRWVVLSGGEALMNPNLFRLCEILRTRAMKITVLSTGLLLKRYATEIIDLTDEVIVSLDGPEPVHNDIRQIPQAFQKLHAGVRAVKSRRPGYRISGRCVIQRLNFRHWPATIDAAHAIGLDQISFLPADVTSEAFNRPELWSGPRAAEVKVAPSELPALEAIIEQIITDYAADFSNRYIAESPGKLRRIYTYYAALHGLGDFPPVRCNAPWVSAVVEADGTVRPCFFHRPLGNIRDDSLADLLNAPVAVDWRKNLHIASNPICHKCVCSLNLKPTATVN